MVVDGSYDVVVLGGGNAALCAALSAAEQGAKVALIERAPEAKRGGNSKFTGGGFRMVHHGAQDIKRIVPDLSDADIARTDFGEYSAEEYLDDLGRITQYYIDPDLAETLVNNSTDTVHWLMGRGVKFLPNYGRQAYNHEGRFKFFGGIVIYANGGGAGLVESEYKAAAKNGIAIHYAHARHGAAAWAERRRGCPRCRRTGPRRPFARKRLCWPAVGSKPIVNGGRATSARAGTWRRCEVLATTLATASAWRSTSAPSPTGQWSGCHAVAWERYAGDYGDYDNWHTAGYRHSYPFGLMVNADGERFVDEGADFRNYTYAQIRPRGAGATRKLRLAVVRRTDASRCCATNTAARRD